jgi:hypothetical protein
VGKGAADTTAAAFIVFEDVESIEAVSLTLFEARARRVRPDPAKLVFGWPSDAIALAAV